MKYILSIITAMAVWTTAVAQSALTTARVWVDGDVAGARTVSLSGGSGSLQLDATALLPGVHVLHSRVGDGTRWGTTASHAFIVPGRSDLTPAATKYTYWVDDNRAKAVTGDLSAEGIATFDLDATALPPGVHVLHSRVGDGTRWHTTASHAFIVPGRSDLTPAATKYTYWVDDNRAEAVTGDLSAEGVATFDIDVENMREGIHFVHSRIGDGTTWGATASSAFVLTLTSSISSRLITGYDYWFNSDVIRHVDLEPMAAPVTLTALALDITDVVANSLENYTFDAVTGLVTVTDDLTFGIRMVNDRGAGEPQLTVFEDYNITLDPQIVLLEHKQPYSGDVPRRGAMRGYSVDFVTPSANVSFSVACSGLKVDFFDNDGNRLEATVEPGNEGTTLYRMRPTVSGKVYALAYDVTEPVAALDVMWKVLTFCDTNDDGYVDVGDVNTVLTDILLGGTNMDLDVNGDGRVDVGDVNTVLWTILEQ